MFPYRMPSTWTTLFNYYLLIKRVFRTGKGYYVKTTLLEFNFRLLVFSLFKLFSIHQFATCIKYLNFVNGGIIIVIADVNGSIFRWVWINNVICIHTLVFLQFIH